MDFTVQNGKASLSISDEHIAVMVGCIATSKNNETGGVLMGYYTEDHMCAVICEVTGPPKDSLSGPTWFKRGIQGLQSLFMRAWQKNQYYLGEWHFHPMGTTNPSGQDLRQMRDIANSHIYQCPEAIMIIMAGSAESYSIMPFLTNRKANTTLPMNSMN